MDYSALSQAELDAEAFRVATEFGKISDQREAIRAEQDRRTQAAKAKARLKALNDQDRDALRKELA